MIIFEPVFALNKKLFAIKADDILSVQQYSKNTCAIFLKPSILIDTEDLEYFTSVQVHGSLKEIITKINENFFS